MQPLLLVHQQTDLRSIRDRWDDIADAQWADARREGRDCCDPAWTRRDDGQRMSGTAAKIAALRASLAKIDLENQETHVRVPLGYDKVDACLHGGLRRGALHEIFAEGGHE